MRKLLSPFQRYYLARKERGYAHIAFAFSVSGGEWSPPKMEKTLLKEERFLETTDFTPDKGIQLDLTNLNADEELYKLRKSFSDRKLHPEKGMRTGFEICRLSEQTSSIEVDFDLSAVRPDFLRICLQKEPIEKKFEAPEPADILYWSQFREVDKKQYDLKGVFTSVSYTLGKIGGEDVYERLLTAYLMNFGAVICGIEEPLIIPKLSGDFQECLKIVKKAYIEGMQHNSFSNWKVAELLGGKFPMFCNFLDCELSYLHITIPDVPYIFAFFRSGEEIMLHLSYDISFSEREISTIYEKFRNTLENSYE